MTGLRRKCSYSIKAPVCAGGVILALLVLTGTGCTYEQMDICSRPVSFASQIAPLVNTHCAISGCHVSGSPTGNFSMYDELKVRAENGKLRLFISELRTMPPDGSITEEQRELINCWIEQGAEQN